MADILPVNFTESSSGIHYPKLSQDLTFSFFLYNKFSEKSCEIRVFPRIQRQFVISLSPAPSNQSRSIWHVICPACMPSSSIFFSTFSNCVVTRALLISDPSGRQNTKLSPFPIPIASALKFYQRIYTHNIYLFSFRESALTLFILQTNLNADFMINPLTECKGISHYVTLIFRETAAYFMIYTHPLTFQYFYSPCCPIGIFIVCLK